MIIYVIKLYTIDSTELKKKHKYRSENIIDKLPLSRFCYTYRVALKMTKNQSIIRAKSNLLMNRLMFRVVFTKHILINLIILFFIPVFVSIESNA